MSLTAPWYRERHQRWQDTLGTIACVLLLSVPLLLATIGYLAWRLWSTLECGGPPHH